MNKAKKIITAILALGVFVGVIFLALAMQQENQAMTSEKYLVVPSAGGIQLYREGEMINVKVQSPLVIGDVLIVPSGENAVIQTLNNTVIRLGSDTKLSFVSDETLGDGLLFELGKGRVWVNGAYTTENINLIAGGAFLISRKGAFDTDYDGIKTSVKVITNQITVGLVKPGIKFTKAVRFGSPQFINSYLMAQGSQTNIYLSKINANVDVLKKLLYSKLIKEFQYNLFDKQEVMKDPWVKQNIDEDSLFSQKVTREKAKLINARGLKIATLDSVGYQLQKAADSFSDTFTFSKERVLSRTVERLFNHVYDSEYLLVYERETEAKQRLTLFGDLISNALTTDSDHLKEPILERLRNIYSDLAYVMPEDKLFEVKTAVSEQLGKILGKTDEDLTEKFSLIRDYMNYAYVLAESNPMLSRLMLDQYSARFTAFIAAEKNNLKRVKNLIAEENQVMDFLLKQYSIFYNEAAFALKHKLEAEWLGMLPEGNDKNEEKQTIASNKIDYLKNVQKYCLDEKVSLDDADKVVSRLIVEIKDLDTGASLGISQLFALRLKDYGQFLMFLKSAQSSSLKGATVREKYDSFLSMQTEQVLIDEAIKDYLKDAGTVQTITTDQILAEINNDFTNAGVADLKLGPLTGVDQTIVAVESASYENKIFSGQYNWGKKLISDVRSEDKLLSQDPIRLDTLKVILNPKEEITPPVDSGTQVSTQQPATQESKAEKVSRVLVIQKLKKSDVAVVEANVWIMDLATGSFLLDNAHLISRSDISFTFNFDNKANLASGVVVHGPTADIPVDGVVALADLAQKVTEAYSGPVDAGNGDSANI